MHLINNTLTDTEFVPTSQSFMWTYARTIPQCPHENNIRGKTADDETYSKMLPYADAISYCRLIEINGVVEIHPAVTLDQFSDMFFVLSNHMRLLYTQDGKHSHALGR